MTKGTKYRIGTIISLSIITFLFGIIWVEFLKIRFNWINISLCFASLFFLIVLWLKALDFDSKIRKKMFLKTGDIKDLELTDLVDDEIKDIVCNPSKLQELQDAAKSKEISDKRDKLIDKILKK